MIEALQQALRKTDVSGSGFCLTLRKKMNYELV